MTRARRRTTVRLARWSATHPWRAVGLWLAFVITAVAVGQLAGLRTMTDQDAAPGQAGVAARMIDDAGLAEPAVENVLITGRHGSLDLTAASGAAADTAHRMRALPNVAAVATPITARDRSAVLVAVTLRGDPAVAGDHLAPLRAATAQVQRDHPALRVEQVGGKSLDAAVNEQVGADLSTAATVSLPITLLILLIAFGAILAAGAPVLLALSAVGSATGLAAVASHVFPDSGTTSSMILLMGMAVGVDYSLFYVKRARSERHRNLRSHLAAIEIAAETSGHSVVVSGVAVVVAMLGLFLAHSAVFASLAAGSIIVVAVAVLGSLTVLPAVLALLGRHIDRPQVPVLWRWSTADREPRLWPWLLRPALNHPRRTLAVSVLLLLALAAPAFGMHVQNATLRTLPQSIPEVQGFGRLLAAFPQEATTSRVVVSAPRASAAAVSARLDSLARELDGDPLFVPGSGSVRASTDGTVHVLSVATPRDPASADARRSVTELRDHLVPEAMRGITGAHWAVGGETARNIDTSRQLSGALPWVIGFVVLLTMLIMGWVFRSAVIALTTAAINLLSTGAAFGVLVLTFQHSWAEGLLGFRSTGTVINWIPLFTFAVLFGLSMDYHVFVMSHIREAAAAGVPTREAVRTGVVRSAGTVTSAAFVMVSVFAIFASLHMVEMKQLGVTLAAAVLVDALVIRSVVLPAAMVLLGRANWWPGPRGSGLREWHRAIDLGRPVAEANRSHAGVG